MHRKVYIRASSPKINVSVRKGAAAAPDHRAAAAEPSPISRRWSWAAVACPWCHGSGGENPPCHGSDWHQLYGHVPASAQVCPNATLS